MMPHEALTSQGCFVGRFWKVKMSLMMSRRYLLLTDPLAPNESKVEGPAMLGESWVLARPLTLSLAARVERPRLVG